MSTIKNSTILLFGGLLLLGFIAKATSAATFNCNTTTCLIDKINKANDEELYPGADIIELTNGTYALTKNNDRDGANGLPSITSTIIIKGGGALDTIIQRNDSSEPFRLFHIASGGSLTLSRLTLRGGLSQGATGLASYGGAILNLSQLFLEDCVVEQNQAAWGGGAIYSDNGTVSIHRCSLTANKAGDAAVPTSGSGGAVAGIGGFGSGLEIVGSSLYSNEAGFIGGAIFQEGGPWISLAILNSTIAKNETGFASPFPNSGGGAIFAERVSGKITNSTIAGNVSDFGGGIESSGSDIELLNTLLAGNSATTGPDCSAGGFSNPIRSLGNNMIGDAAGCFLTGPTPISCVGQDAQACPGLGNFTNLGTPGSQYFPLLSTSAAVDAGNDVILADTRLHTDQLGEIRDDGDNNKVYAPDIGAVEYQHPDTPNHYRFVVLADSRDPCKINKDPKCEDPDNPGVSRTDGHGVNEYVLPNVLKKIKNKLYKDLPIQLQPEFILFPGDLVTGMLAGKDVEDELSDQTDPKSWVNVVNAVFPEAEGYGSNFALRKIYPTWGGHERNDTGSGYPKRYTAFTKAFDPRNTGVLGVDACNYLDPALNNLSVHTEKSFGHTVYYCDYANARFFFLNNDCNPDPADPSACGQDYLNSAQFDWLKDLLEPAVRRQLNFFVQHEPAFGTGARGVTPPLAMDRVPGLRNRYIDLLLRKGATMMFTGHEHQYSRRYVSQYLLEQEVNRQALVFIIKQADPNRIGPVRAYSFDGGGEDKAPWLFIEWTNANGEEGLGWFNVESGSDDAEQFVSYKGSETYGTNMYLQSSDLELMNDTNRGIQSHVGLQFGNAWHIPVGATIDNAVLTFTARGNSGSSEAAITVVGEIPKSTAAFEFKDNNISSREMTTTSVDASFSGWQEGEEYSVNVTSIVSEIVRSQWWGGYSPSDLYLQQQPFFEVKTGTAGAEFYPRHKDDYMTDVIQIVPNVGEKDPDPYKNAAYHFAVIDVIGGSHVNVVVMDDTGTCIDYFAHQQGFARVMPFHVTLDTDLDAVPDVCEGAGDFDSDGVIDSQDVDTAAMPLTGGAAGFVDVDEGQVPTIALTKVQAIKETTSAVDQDTAPDVDFPYGLLQMDVTGVNDPGQTITATLTFPAPVPVDASYWKYDESRGWYSLPIGSNDGDNVITIELTDGGDGDADGEANGTIVDFGGVAVPSSPQKPANDAVTVAIDATTLSSSPDTSNCTGEEEGMTPSDFQREYRFALTLSAKLPTALENITLSVTELGGDNLLESAEGGLGSIGALVSVPRTGDYADGVLSPGETVDMELAVCVRELSNFTFAIDVLAERNDSGTAVVGFDLLPVGVDLAISSNDVPSEIVVGDEITIDYTISINGQSNVTDLVFKSELPALLGFVSATSTSAECAETDGLLECNANGLSVDETLAIEVVLVANAAGIVDQSVAIEALLEQEIDNENNSLSHTITINKPTPPPDEDEDGIPDEEDTCPASDLSPTVVIDGCDSEVENHLLEDGCTISDRVMACADGASNHGKFVRCVAKMTNDLKKGGIISGQEKGAIQSCAAQANIP